MDTSPSDQAPKQASSPQVEQTQPADTKFLEDIDSSLDQLKGLLDVPGEHEVSSSTPEQKVEQKAEGANIKKNIKKRQSQKRLQNHKNL